jgi:hypothetical protein
LQGGDRAADLACPGAEAGYCLGCALVIGVEQGEQEVTGADAVIAMRRRLGQDRLDQGARGPGLRHRPGLLPVPGGDLSGLLAYLLLADAQPLQRACGCALVLGGQAEQEVAGVQWRWPSRRASRKAAATASRAGLVKGRNPVVRVWMPGVCLRAGLTAASWVRMIHLARVLRLGCCAGMGSCLAGDARSPGSQPPRCGAVPAGAGQRLGLLSVTTC